MPSAAARTRRPTLRRHAVSLAGIVAVVLAGMAPAADAAEREQQGDGLELWKIDPEVLGDAPRNLTAAGDGRVEAVVVFAPSPTASTGAASADEVTDVLEEHARTVQAPVIETVQRLGDEVLNTFWLKNMILVRATPATLQSLTAFNTVTEIIPNFDLQVSPTTATTAASSAADTAWGVDRIGANAVHRQFGRTGDGVRVAVLDTGVDVTHPDLAGRLATDDPTDPSYPGGWIEFSRTGQPVPSSPHDSERHGTHVSSTALGGGTSGTQIGVAPGAELMAALVLPGGSGSLTQVIAGMQWAVAPFDASGNPAGQPADIVNMSLSTTARFAQMIEPTRNMLAAGVFPAFAIGNNCSGASGSPGNVFEAVGVGATDRDDDIGDFSCGEVVFRSDWSNPPPEWPETYVVPDVSAPGVDIFSAFPGGQYGTLDGTSMATPHVAGAVALMLESRPDLAPDQLLQTLIDTSFFDDRYGANRPNPRYGWGRIDAYRAVAQVSFGGGIAGTITDAETGEPIPNATIEQVDAGRAVPTDAVGRYEVRLPGGTYDLRISMLGYEPVNIADVHVEDDQFTGLSQALTPLPRGAISGRVSFGPSGSAVPGATVRLVGVPGDYSAVTAVNGSYTIDDVPEGTFQVTAAAPSVPRSPGAEVTVVAGKKTRLVDLTLPRPWSTTRVSTAGDGTEADGESLVPMISANGRYVAYYSFGETLVPGDANGRSDVFVYDRQTGVTEIVSVAGDGTQGDGNSVRPVISADGRFVAFSSFATNIVDGDTNGQSDVFVYDRQTGTTERVSVVSGGGQADRSSFVPAISADGRHVSFYSFATNLIDDDTNGQADVYVHDRQAGTTERVSVTTGGGQSNSGSFESSISADGRHVAFYSFASTLVDGDTNGQADVFVHDRDSGVTKRVSVATDGTQGDGASQIAMLSGDGRHVAFHSTATTLVGGDTNELADVFVHDRETGVTERVSEAADGTDSSGPSQFAALSANGRFVAYHSTGSNLVAGDTNGRADVFVLDRETGVTERISLASDGVQGDRPSERPALSADGRYVTYSSDAETLVTGDTNREGDIFLHDRTPDAHAQFALWNLLVAPATPRTGQPVTVLAHVKNVGDAAGDYDAVLRIDGVDHATRTVSLRPGETATVSFQVGAGEPGTHVVTVGALVGQFTVGSG